MTFKPSPIFGFDISTWQDSPYIPGHVDFHKMRDYGAAFVIIKVGQGDHLDPDFPVSWATAKGVLPRGAYWFYDPVYNPSYQSKLCIDALKTDPPEGRVWLDLEFLWDGQYALMNDWLHFLEAVQDAGLRAGIYTANWWWKPQVTDLHPTHPFGAFETWIAQYNTSLTQVPKGLKEPMLWQDGTPSIGKEAGVESQKIDHDIWNENFNFISEWKTPPPIPSPDVLTDPFPGVRRVSGTRHGWKFELFVTDPDRARFEIPCQPALYTPSRVAKFTGAPLAFNGGEWDRISRPKDYSVWNGTVTVPRVQAVPSLLIFDDGAVTIDHRAMFNVKQALSGLRYLIQAGAIQPYLSGTEPQYTEGHARSIHGVDASGFHLCLTSEGAYPNQGLTLKQAAEIMKQYGAVTAFDSGGGGDAVAVMNGLPLTVPENIDPTTLEHFERPLPQVLIIFPKESTMANGTAKELKGNTSTIRSKPSRYGQDTGKRVAPYATIEFVKVVSVELSGPADAPSDQWFELPDGNFVNYILGGVKYYNILTQPTTPPPTTTAALLDIIITDPGTGKKYGGTGIELPEIP